MNILKTIQEKILTELISFLLGAIVATVVWLGPDLAPILPALVELLPGITLLKLLILSLLLLASSFVVIALLVNSVRSKLKPYFGLLWDKKLNPHCPSCKTLLSRHDTYEQKTSFWCVQDKQWIELKDDVGRFVTLDIARECIRQNRKNAATLLT